MTSHGRLVPAAVLALLGAPLVVALTEAMTFHVATRSDHVMASSGVQRDYVLHVSRTYDATKPTALVISLHGAALWGAAQRAITRWDSVADGHGFLVVYPSAERGSGPSVWHVERGIGLSRDVRFISDLIDTLRTHYNIDPRRVYADGLSNGGGMAFVLSCTLSDRIAAVGLVASAQTLPFDWCRDRRPVPMIDIHGTADPVVPYRGAEAWIAPRPFPAVPAFAAKWARRNGCAPKPVDSVFARDVVRREYMHCDNEATVELLTVNGGGHTWPGGPPFAEAWLGRTTRSIDASSEIWRFFEQHRLAP